MLGRRVILFDFDAICTGATNQRDGPFIGEWFIIGTGISSFQALSVSLSGRVGVGNIAGVAAAIGFGGPGAVFWMWVVAFLGASTAYVESTLGQIYKVEYQGQYRGGPAFYFDRGLGQRWLGFYLPLPRWCLADYFYREFRPMQ